MCSLSKCSTASSCSDDDVIGGDKLRRGPWTVEEDSLLIYYISGHGEGRWNLLAKRSGLKRTGKSCRLRWLNYLKPDVKRGNLSPEEQLLILELHSKLGNRWSKIAQHLPGRTDNEIKNHWRTRVQKQARHLKIDSNSKQFQELIRRVWMPRLLQKVLENNNNNALFWDSSTHNSLEIQGAISNSLAAPPQINSSSPSRMSSSESSNISPVPQISKYLENPFCGFEPNNYYSHNSQNECYHVDNTSYQDVENLSSAAPVMGSAMENNYWLSGDLGYCLWNIYE
ncbi:hypothetical protein ACH5RR_008589 [Cinchona calisaya]|uniref:Uncharacterized protein n=1 Tax=Cinchona calisaya TaxID=153742 RepID=A0ABD3AER9_9GENT